MFPSIAFSIMLILALGIGSQWLAWRFRLPAIVIMSVAGLLAGPALGLLHPQTMFGELFQPVISLAVALILFEGSLNLDVREVRGFSRPLARIVTIGAFIAWIAGSLAAHFLAGLSLAVAFIIGGLFIVTGPTVILPLLRQAKLKPRAAAMLKWEGIVVDPFGALLAVFAYEGIKFFEGGSDASALARFLAGSAVAALGGYLLARLLGRLLRRGAIPEFLKSPIVISLVLFAFVASDVFVHETGLLAVTAMGITMANLRLPAMAEMRNFKETVSIILISSVFITLTASLTRETLLGILNWRIALFVLAMLFVVRPLSIWVSTIGTELTYRERFLIGWIAPRGIVALTVSSYFASILLADGYEDAALLTPLTFALVFSTVVAHGFSLSWLAKKLKLVSGETPGVLIVGSNAFTAALGKSLADLGVETIVLDRSFEQLSQARAAGVRTFAGDMLSEQTAYYLDLTLYPTILAATKSDDYNALLCANLAPDYGRDALYQTPVHTGKLDGATEPAGIVAFAERASIAFLTECLQRGFAIRKTRITDQYSYTAYLRHREAETVLLYIYRKSGEVDFYTVGAELQASAGDVVVSFAKPAPKHLERAGRAPA